MSNSACFNFLMNLITLVLATRKEGLAECFIEEFDYKMCLSGYNQIERDNILREGRARYCLKGGRDQCTDLQDGVRRKEAFQN